MRTWKDFDFKIDNAAGTITDITSATNSGQAGGGMDMLSYIVFGASNRTKEPGQGDGTMQVNGYINSTTDAIFGPLVGARTSITKTCGLFNGEKWITGEFYPMDTQISATAGELGMWSCTLELSGSPSHTSVAPT